MSLVGKFSYYFKKNNPKHITVVCKVYECPWKITCNIVGYTGIVQVHTFQNAHNHSLDDVGSFKPLV